MGAPENEAAATVRPAATLEYARFAERLRFDDIPRDVVRIAKEQLLATIGSCLAGTHMPGAESLRRGSRILGRGEEATLFGLPEKAPAPTAALFNSGTAQIIE